MPKHEKSVGLGLLFCASLVAFYGGICSEFELIVVLTGPPPATNFPDQDQTCPEG